ncbi:MAG: hypothetical protein KBT48_11125 [Firmicutes bacterium]|nr:hypothetical protein [Bacillota bacterium]
MNKFVKVLSATGMAAILAACSSSTSAPAAPAEEGSSKVTGTYVANIAAEDYGCGVDKMVVTLDNPIDAIKAEDLKVTEVKEGFDWAAEGGPTHVMDLTTERKVLDAKVDGTELTIDLAIDPDNGSPIWWSLETQFNSWSDPYTLNVELAEGAKITSGGTEVTELSIDPTPAKMVSPADDWTQTKMSAGGIDYNVAEYKVDGSDKLFVWLHGMGEGGSGVEGLKTDAAVTILANKVTALAGEDFQTTLGGCNVIAPQSPTMWMQGEDEKDIAGPRHSFYEQSLIELIDNYVAENNIKTVFIGGCSNGGYMTMNLAMECGDKYQGYVPICEAMLDEYITDEDIATLAKTNLYFIWAKNDDTVDPTKYEIPTTERLEKAGAKFSVFNPDDVHDTTGKYNDEDGKPHQYSGHWSWCYFDNDETADQNGVSAFDWLASLLK